MKLTSRFWALLVFTFVGYQEVTITKGVWALFTATFEAVDGSNGVDIQDIRVIDPDTGAEYGTANRVKIQLIETKSSGAYGISYNWRTTTAGTGWHTGSTPESYVARNTLVLSNAQCFAVNSGAPKNLKFRFSGQVCIDPESMKVPKSQWEIIGNMTPVRIDIQDAVPYTAAGVIVSSANRVKIQKIDTPASGAYGDSYNWRTTTAGTGWHTGSSADTYVARDTIYLEPGDGFAVNNGLTTSDYIYFKFPKPIKEEVK